MFYLHDLVNLLPASGQSEMLNNKKCYVKDAPEVSPLTAGFCPCTQS